MTDYLPVDAGAAFQLQDNRLIGRLRGSRQGHADVVASGRNPPAVELETGGCVFQHHLDLAVEFIFLQCVYADWNDAPGAHTEAGRRNA